jgi:hypothetical protein
MARIALPAISGGCHPQVASRMAMPAIAIVDKTFSAYFLQLL